jgi:peptidoglycan hydrolase-like protein with peptidoglycan-binding domain
VTGPVVRRLQRAINASGAGRGPVSGVYSWKTMEAVKDYQSAVGLSATGVANPKVWKKLRRGAS